MATTADNMLAYPAICTRVGQFYSGPSLPDINHTGTTSTGREIQVGDWVQIIMFQGEVITVDDKEPILPTSFAGDTLMVTANVQFLPPSPGNDFHRGYAIDFDDKIFVPPAADLKAYTMGLPYKVSITPMDDQERNWYWQKTNERARWKLAVTPQPLTQPLLNKTEQKQHQLVQITGSPLAKTANAQTMELKGLVVGKAPSSPSEWYVWTADAPLHCDGFLTEEADKKVKIGTYIEFSVDYDQGMEIFSRKKPLHFRVLSYKITDPLFPTKVTRNTKKEGAFVIELRVPNFTVIEANFRLIRGEAGMMVIDENFRQLADDRGLLKKYSDGTVLDLILIRVKPTTTWTSQWRITNVDNVRAPPPNYVARPQISMTVKNEVVAAATRAPSPPAPAMTETTCASTSSRQVTVASSPSVEQITNGMERITVESLKQHEHVAFVEAHANFGTFIWIIDAPQQAMVSPRKDKVKPEIGSFVVGIFKKQADGRLFSDDWRECLGPHDCLVQEKAGHAVAKTDVIYDARRQTYYSRYLGVIEDRHFQLPRNAVDGDRHLCQIGKRKKKDCGQFVWTVEAVVQLNSGPRAVSRSTSVNGGGQAQAASSATTRNGAKNNDTNNNGGRGGGGQTASATKKTPNDAKKAGTKVAAATNKKAGRTAFEGRSNRFVIDDDEFNIGGGDDDAEDGASGTSSTSSSKKSDNDGFVDPKRRPKRR